MNDEGIPTANYNTSNEALLEEGEKARVDDWSSKCCFKEDRSARLENVAGYIMCASYAGDPDFDATPPVPRDCGMALEAYTLTTGRYFINDAGAPIVSYSSPSEALREEGEKAVMNDSSAKCCFREDLSGESEYVKGLIMCDPAAAARIEPVEEAPIRPPTSFACGIQQSDWRISVGSFDTTDFGLAQMELTTRDENLQREADVAATGSSEAKCCFDHSTSNPDEGTIRCSAEAQGFGLRPRRGGAGFALAAEREEERN